MSACDDADCAGSGFERVDFTYDGEGHRTAILHTPAVGTPVETTFRYAGDAIVAEYEDGTLTREYITDDAGTISKVIVPAGQPDAGTYLVTWNGHGDAMALWKIESTGALTLANSFTYGTWGEPTTATHNSIGDLGFRFLYVGMWDVQWDAVLGLHYTHARHYSPDLGRFLQPDPSRLDVQVFAYGASSPVTKVDPSGLASSLIPNEMEWAYCHRNLHRCTVWMRSAAEAFRVAMMYPHPKRNAMRHCIWQCLVTHRWSWKAAEQWGWRHEWRTSAPMDSKADYHNNYVGRLIGEQLDRLYLPDDVVRAQLLCNEAWNRGWLWYVRRVNGRARIYWSDGRYLPNPQSGPYRP